MTATEDLIQSASPPDDPEWVKSETSSVFADLIGAACGLIQAAPIIEKSLIAHGRDETFGFWKREALFEDFLTAVKSMEEAKFPWDHSDNFCAWSGLFFLNKAENNLAAALDICLNAWLRWRVDDLNLHDLEADDAWIMVMLRTKTMILRHGMSGRPAELLAELKKCCENDEGTRAARSFIQELRNECEGMRLEDVYTFIRSTKRIDPIVCALVVFNRVNEFKHRVHGLMDRLGIDYAIEWAVACLAHEGVSRLWKEGMLLDTQRLWKSDPPASNLEAGGIFT